MPRLNLHASWFRLAEARLRLTRATVEVTFAEELIHTHATEFLNSLKLNRTNTFELYHYPES
jgi:hypothetical protein